MSFSLSDMVMRSNKSWGERCILRKQSPWDKSLMKVAACFGHFYHMNPRVYACLLCGKSSLNGLKSESDAWSFSKFPGLFTRQGKLNARWAILGWSLKLEKKNLSGLIKRINFELMIYNCEDLSCIIVSAYFSMKDTWISKKTTRRQCSCKIYFCSLSDTNQMSCFCLLGMP